MIGRIRGTLLEKQLTEILLDVNGIAYEISVPMSTLYQLPETGQGLRVGSHAGSRTSLHRTMTRAERRKIWL